MQVFKCFFAIVRRNLGMMIMYAVIFIGITVIVTSVVPQETKTNFEDTRLSVTVIDRDGSAASEDLAQWLYQRQDPVPLEDDEEILQDALYRRTTQYILYIPEGYGASLSSGDVLPLEAKVVPGSYQTSYIDEQLKACVGAVQAYIYAGFSPEAAFAAAADDTDIQTQTQLTQAQISELPDMYYYFLYLCYGLGMVMMFGLAPTLLAIGRQDVLARTNASALPLRRKNLQLGLGAGLLAVACFVLFALVALIMYPDQLLSISGAVCLLNALVFVLFSTALGLLVGQVAKNGNMISAIANVVIMGMCFLGGIFVQTDLLSSSMQTVAKFLPTYWYAQVARAAVGFDGAADIVMRPVLEGIGMQLLFTLALVSVALVVSRKKQQIA